MPIRKYLKNPMEVHLLLTKEVFISEMMRYIEIAKEEKRDGIKFVDGKKEIILEVRF